MSGHKRARKMLSAAVPRFSVPQPPVLTLDQAAYMQHWKTVLRRSYANQNKPVESLAADAGASVPAAKKWWGGETTPSGRYLLNLMARRPDIAAEVRRLTEMEAEFDPEFDRAATAFYQLVSRIRQGALR